MSNFVEGGHDFFNFFKGGHLLKSLGNPGVNTLILKKKQVFIICVRKLVYLNWNYL